MTNFSLTHPLVLASGSPRRQELMKILGFPFDVLISDVEENFPPEMDPYLVPGLLSEKKAKAVLGLRPDALVLSADTVVIANGLILNKPIDHREARQMLTLLSGRTHDVVTAFTLSSCRQSETISDLARVTFKTLSESEIDYYLENGHPLDKAGAYGIQEWIGLIAVEKMEGSYFTVMGLPMHLVWNSLFQNFVKTL